MPELHPAPPGAFVLGIDPGAETGLAAVDVATGELRAVTSAGPLATVRQLDAWAAERTPDGSPVLAGAYVEDARGLPLYARHGGRSRGERDRVARSVGRVDCLTELYVGLLESLGVPVQTVEPVRAAKWTAADLARLSGYTARTNVHGRDAARLVLGRGVPRALAPPRPPAPERSGGNNGRSTTPRGVRGNLPASR